MTFNETITLLNAQISMLHMRLRPLKPSEFAITLATEHEFSSTEMRRSII